MPQASTQSFLPIETIKNQTIILRNGGMRALLLCSSINSSSIKRFKSLTLLNCSKVVKLFLICHRHEFHVSSSIFGKYPLIKVLKFWLIVENSGFLCRDGIVFKY